MTLDTEWAIEGDRSTEVNLDQLTNDHTVGERDLWTSSTKSSGELRTVRLVSSRVSFPVESRRWEEGRLSSPNPE